MNAICLPAGTPYVRFDELPRLLAEALHPESAEDDDNIALGAAWLDYESGELRRAVESGELVVKNPLTRLPLSFIRGHALNRGVVMIADLQAFASGLGLSVIVGAPAQSPAEPAPLAPSASHAPVVAETVAQRRARWLHMYEAEEKREKRGALQRLADSENVDRSNMKKDIEKARGARDTERRAGTWTSQIVRDGKRKG